MTLGAVDNWLDIFVFCRCLDLKYYPVDSATLAEQLVVEYNLVFQQLKMFIIDLRDWQLYKLSREAEVLTAKREARRRHVSEAKASPTWPTLTL